MKICRAGSERLASPGKQGRSMNRRDIHAPEAPAASGGYARAIEVEKPTRMPYLSGQIPTSAGGAVPDAFGEQCRLVWRNVEAQLHAADMTLDNLVKVTTFLSD